MSEMDEVTEGKVKTAQRKESDKVSLEKAKKREEEWAQKIKPVVESVEADVVDTNESDADFNVPEVTEATRMVLRNLAKECDRWGVSNRAGAAIANAALIDAGIITPEDQKHVIDKNKLRRAIEKYRN